MKHLLFIAALAAAAPALAANVSVSIGEPGFYGRLDIGGHPPPQVIYRQPRAVVQVPRDRPPIYLRVPPGHAKKWSKHCREYNACDERVFFVQDNWYKREYVPRHQERQRNHQDDRKGKPNDDRREQPKDDHRGGGTDEPRGRDR